ncbi:mannose-6-phosphate isomerase, class I [Mariniluteicoccus flavus]
MFRIDGVVQAYDWGSTDGIPGVLGTEPTGEPQAELWLGAHPKAPSTDPDNDHTPLDAHLDAHPDQLGAATRERFGDRLPYLLKILSADRALSLQAHPSREQAEDGHAREDEAGVRPDAPDRNYRDTWPKPEAMVALTEFHGLCGFRDPARTRALVDALGVPAASELVEPLTDNDGLARVFLEILALADQEGDVVAAVVEAARAHAGDDSELGLLCRTAVELDEHYPGDPGILAALLLNRIHLAPGEAFFMPAGNLHAYLHGTGIEIMAASDNVLRGGLTSKHVDIDELARVVDFRPGLPAPVVAEPVAPGVRRFTTPAPEFALFEVTGEADLPAPDGARIVLVVEGEATLTGPSGELTLPRGAAAFVPAGEDVGVRGSARTFVAAPGA